MSTVIVLPRTLPLEVWGLIWSYVAPPSRIGVDGFRPAPKVSDEKSVIWFSLVCKNTYFHAQTLLRYPFIGTEARAQAIIRTLQLPVTLIHPGGEQQIIPNFRAPTVRSLHLKFSERNKVVSSGVEASTVVRLAALMPNLEILDLTLCDVGSTDDGRSISTFSPAIAEGCQKFVGIKELTVQGKSQVSLDEVITLAISLGLVVFKIKSINSHVHCPPLITSPIIKRLATLPSIHKVWGHNITNFVLYDCFIAPGIVEAILSFFIPQKFRKLTFNRIRTGGRTITSDPFPPPETPYAFTAQLLLPFIPYLHDFHLVLFDRAPITNNAQRQRLVQLGQLRNGHLTPSPNSLTHTLPRLADDLAPHFSEDLHTLTIGGPLCLTPKFFKNFSSSSLRYLNLDSCADMTPLTPPGNGIHVDHFRELLELGWAKSLRSIDIKGMEEKDMDQNPLWDWEAVKTVEKKLEEIGEKSGRKIEFTYDNQPPPPPSPPTPEKVKKTSSKKSNKNKSDDGKKSKKTSRK